MVEDELDNRLRVRRTDSGTEKKERPGCVGGMAMDSAEISVFTKLNRRLTQKSKLVSRLSLNALTSGDAVAAQQGAGIAGADAH